MGKIIKPVEDMTQHLKGVEPYYQVTTCSVSVNKIGVRGWLGGESNYHVGPKRVSTCVVCA